MAHGCPSYNNRKHSTSLRYPISITIIDWALFFNFSASRWSDDEFVVGKEDEIYQQDSLLGDFFQKMFGGRKERHENDQFASIEPFLSQIP